MPWPMFLSVFGFCQKRKLAEAKENWSSPSTFNLFVSLPKPQSQQQLWSDLSSWEVHLERKWHFLPDAGKQTQLRFGWTRWQPELSPDYKDVERKFTPLPLPEEPAVVVWPLALGFSPEVARTGVCCGRVCAHVLALGASGATCLHATLHGLCHCFTHVGGSKNTGTFSLTLKIIRLVQDHFLVFQNSKIFQKRQQFAWL